MDAIYESSDPKLDPSLPPELAAILAIEEHETQITKVTAAAERNCDELLLIIEGKIADLVKEDPRLKISQRSITNWSKKFEVRLKRDRSKMRGFVEVWIESCQTLGLSLHCILWTPGGKAAAVRNATIFRNLSGKRLLKGTEDREMSWDNGVLLLARVPFKNHLGDEEVPALDLDSVVEATYGEITALCLPDALAEVLNAGR
jgi:hypothetical protein